MNYCAECGASMQAHDRFCGECGKAIGKKAVSGRDEITSSESLPVTLATDQVHTQALHVLAKSKAPQDGVQQQVAPDESRQPSLLASGALTEGSRPDIEETPSVVIEEYKTNEKIVEPVFNQYSASNNVASEKISAEALAFLVLFSLAGCAFVAGYFGLNIAICIFFSLYAPSFLEWKVPTPNFTWTSRRFSNLASVKIRKNGVYLAAVAFSIFTLYQGYKYLPAVHQGYTANANSDSNKANPSAVSEKDPIYLYAQGLVNNFRPYAPCQMIAQAIMNVASSGNPDNVKTRQIDTLFDKAPEMCLQ